MWASRRLCSALVGLSAASKSLQRISTTGSTYFKKTMDIFLS